MFIEKRITHVRYALDRREAILKSKINRRFPVSVFAVYRRVSKIEEWRDELDQIINAALRDQDDALERLKKIEETLFGVL